MDIHQNPLWLSVMLGRWFRTDVRVSVWFLLILLMLTWRLGLNLGATVFAILCVSILFHEFAHVFAARRTGGSGHEILLWPLGGLAFVTPGPSVASEVWTVLAGPLLNLGFCLTCLPGVLSAGLLRESMHPIVLPPVDLSGHFAKSLVLLIFSVNFKLLIINLLPVYPLDGGQLSFIVARQFWERTTAKIGSLWFGMIVCILVSVVAVLGKSIDGVFLSSLLLMFCMHEYITSQISRQFDDSFLGYDFSQGYTSLERMDSQESSARAPGPLARWRQQRAAKKREKVELQRLETERRVDELLQKVHIDGMNSLTDAERRFLQRASGRYRNQK